MTSQGGPNFRGAPSLESQDVRVVHAFESDVFSGAAVETSDHTEDDLLALPQVARVWRNRVVYLEPSNDTQTFSDDANSANYTSHHLTKVSTLHDSGVKGKGAKVAIVDTGIQYTHPAVSSFSGCGKFLVVGLGADNNSSAAASVTASRLLVVMTLSATSVSPLAVPCVYGSSRNS